MSFAKLEIFNVESGQITALLETDRHIEAPNWAGEALIVNAEGKLFRVALDAPELVEIDTGGHTQCNNDHGLSPDGRWLVISDSSEAGESCIYTLPATGGVPERITMQTPSWWHGWSPDGETLAYTCRREGVFGIATIPEAGGDETVLIAGRGHYDGPDYTPDGAHIWFNSDRGGQMNLWRMRADGSEPEEMTGGDSVDWFPHPSPDGRNVVFLSYPPGTSGHPFGRDVELRMMPAAGGAAKTLVSLYGGQGTINVPSWSPDGRRFAFVRYARPAES
ncbi:hypothetical protein [Oceanicola sp. 502str15]|uniref:TolB family protein n=1 Tax=Oceanicola sp. 502str15 TaxID=2696061 RepID=UPI0020953051|nr:hypothetical protein [Oceanicola sp. 502str15]MCO6384824.1 hypothetical protein [Oceanicola sp. 502str15]